MNKFNIPVVLAIAFFTHSACYAADALNPEQFVRQRGWKPFDGGHVVRSPHPEIAPALYYKKGSSVPNCGLIAASPDAREPSLIELVSSDLNMDYPQCISVVAMNAFKLNNKPYLAVEYISRDTREDFYRSFYYVYRDAGKGYVPDVALIEAIPDIPAEATAGFPTESKSMDGIRLARSAFLAKAFPYWRLQERHFISDNTSSFAIFEEKKTGLCYFVVEAGGTPVALHHKEFVPGENCAGVLASSVLQITGSKYYLAMFKSDRGTHLVAVASVSRDGRIIAEKALSDAVNRSGATKDIRSAKTSLSSLLR